MMRRSTKLLAVILAAVSMPAYAGQPKDVVGDYGAVPNDGLSDLAAFQNVCADAVTNESIYVPPGNYDGVNLGTFTCTKDLYWLADGARDGLGTSPLSLPGAVENMFEQRKLVRRTQSSPNEHSLLNVQAYANHTGGTPGFVTAPVRVETQINPGVTDYFWGVLSTVNNWAPAGEPTAVYGQMVRKTGTAPNGVVSTGGWSAAGVFNFIDEAASNNPGVGQVVLELDHKGNGTDNTGNGGKGSKELLHMVVLKKNAGGSANEVGWGLRATCGNADNTQCHFKRFVSLEAPFASGFDTSDGVQDVGGAAFKSKENQDWVLGNTSVGQVKFHLNSAQRRIEFLENGVLRGWLDLNAVPHAM